MPSIVQKRKSSTATVVEPLRAIQPGKSAVASDRVSRLRDLEYLPGLEGDSLHLPGIQPEHVVVDTEIRVREVFVINRSHQRAIAEHAAVHLHIDVVGNHPKHIHPAFCPPLRILVRRHIHRDIQRVPECNNRIHVHEQRLSAGILWRRPHFKRKHHLVADRNRLFVPVPTVLCDTNDRVSGPQIGRSAGNSPARSEATATAILHLLVELVI